MSMMYKSVLYVYVLLEYGIYDINVVENIFHTIFRIEYN